MIGKETGQKISSFLYQPVPTLQRRLLLFLLLLVCTMLFGLSAILVATGVISIASKETQKLFSAELARLTDNINHQYGGASLQATRLSENLAANIDNQMKSAGLTAEDLKKHPEMLQAVLTQQLTTLLTALDNTDCSGVFVALNATVNPSLPGAEHSKAGLYIRTIEPNVNGTGSRARLLLRGFPSLAVDGSLFMQAKWDLEFDVANRSFWSQPIAAYLANRSLPLSRLVYWSNESPVANLDENVMTCSIPLIDHNGSVFGVCGFEISSMNFMLRYNPDIPTYPHSGFMLSAYNRNTLNTRAALFSGDTAICQTLNPAGGLKPSGNDGGLTIYKNPAGIYVGLHKEIELFPYDSPFVAQTFAAAIFAPQADFDAIKERQTTIYILIFIMLLALGVVASVILSKHYVKPITDRLANLGEDKLSEKTNIAEIDLLIERMQAKGQTIPDELFGDFIDRIKTLTPTELVVFQCHGEGLSYEEIMEKMYIASGTLKNHNRHIFAKLNVSSQGELRLYISLLKKCGLMSKIWSENGAKETDS